MANTKNKEHQRSFQYAHRDPSHKHHSSTLNPVGNKKETKSIYKGRIREEARRSKDRQERKFAVGRVPTIVNI